MESIRYPGGDQVKYGIMPSVSHEKKALKAIIL